MGGRRRAVGGALGALVVLGVVAVVVLRGPHDPDSDPDVSRVERSLTYRPTDLERPLVVRLTPEDGSPPRFGPDQDVVVQLPSTPMRVGVVLLGGRNVRLVGGEVRARGRALYLKDQRGQVYVEGLKITGKATTEGIDLDQRYGSTVVLQNIYIERITGTYETNHADLLQTWAGPARLFVDRFRGTSTYQGMFLLPRQQWPEGPWPRAWRFDNVQIDVDRGAYALWTDGGRRFPIEIGRSVWADPRDPEDRDSWLWPKPSTGDGTWAGVRAGAPRSDVVDPAHVGLGYRSAWPGVSP